MSDIRVSVTPLAISIRVDDQHLSRLTRPEVREIILQVLMFGGKKLREEVRGWIDGKLDEIAAVIAPEQAIK